MSAAEKLAGLRAHWRAGEGTSGTSIVLGSILSARLAFQLGWDVVTIDMQHGAISDAELPAILQASAGFGAAPFVRVSQNDPAAIMRALDTGALGIFCPQIESAAAAAAFVSACFYPPMGSRSIGPLLAEALHGPSYVETVAPAVLPFAMIETEKGLAALGEIVAVDGLAGVYVGTSDLSLSLGYGTRFDPDVPALREAIKEVADHTHDSGRIAAIHVANVAHVPAVRSFGYDLVVVSSDYRLLQSAMAALKNATSIALRPVP